MKFKRLINKSKETRRKYEYYLSLGYMGMRSLYFSLNSLAGRMSWRNCMPGCTREKKERRKRQ